MSNTYTTTGIILKRRDYQEHDRLFTVYSEEYGKIELLAKGTKKISSKLNAYLEPFYLVKIMAAKGKVIDKLANCDLVESFPNIRANIIGFYLLNYLAEITDGLIVGQTYKQDKFQLLLNLLEILDNKIKDYDQDNLLMLANIYGLKLLGLLGYQPEIRRCLHCHKGILLTKNIFDFAQGGIICENCKKVCLISDYIMVSDGVIKLLQITQEKDIKQLSEIKALSEEINQFNQVVYKLLLINLERPIKTYPIFI